MFMKIHCNHDALENNKTFGTILSRKKKSNLEKGDEKVHTSKYEITKS